MINRLYGIFKSWNYISLLFGENLLRTLFTMLPFKLLNLITLASYFDDFITSEPCNYVCKKRGNMEMPIVILDEHVILRI